MTHSATISTPRADLTDAAVIRRRMIDDLNAAD